MKCKCGRVFEAQDSLGSTFGKCQDCWEAECADEWWHWFYGGAVNVDHK